MGHWYDTDSSNVLNVSNYFRLGSPPSPFYRAEIYESNSNLVTDHSIVRIRGIASVDASRTTEFWGQTALRIESEDQPGVVAGTAPYLFGVRVRVVPRVGRTLTAVDDVAGVIVVNKSFTDLGAVYNGTEAFYVGHSGGATKDWNGGIGIDTIADRAIAIDRGPYQYGILITGSITTAAMRMPNNVSIVGRNAANSTNVGIVKVTAADDIQIGNFMWVSTTAERIAIGSVSAMAFPFEVYAAGGTDGVVTKVVPRFVDTSAFAANVGASLTLGGYVDAVPTTRTFGAIKGGKANATSGNTAGYLALYSRHATNGIAEVFRLDENQDVVFADAVDLKFNATTGTKIGTATTEKLAFYGTTPIVKQTGVAVTAAGVHAALVNLGLIAA